MDLGIKNTAALLMSSTRGLGFGCARALAAEGVRVVINGRDPGRGAEAVKELGSGAHFIQADVSRPEERARLFEEASSLVGPVSILVTNVDGPPGGPFVSKSIADWQAAFEMIMLSAIDMVNRALPGMIEKGFGRIINMSSISAREIRPGLPLTAGMKPGLIGALGTLAREVADRGVTVNSILPGPFDTDLLKRFAGYAVGDPGLPPEEALRRYAEMVPVKRLGRTEEFGALCAFLCSRHAGYITGQSIVIDGGFLPVLM